MKNIPPLAITYERLPQFSQASATIQGQERLNPLPCPPQTAYGWGREIDYAAAAALLYSRDKLYSWPDINFQGNYKCSSSKLIVLMLGAPLPSDGRSDVERGLKAVNQPITPIPLSEWERGLDSNV